MVEGAVLVFLCQCMSWRVCTSPLTDMHTCAYSSRSCGLVGEPSSPGLFSLKPSLSAGPKDLQSSLLRGCPVSSPLALALQEGLDTQLSLTPVWEVCPPVSTLAACASEIAEASPSPGLTFSRVLSHSSYFLNRLLCWVKLLICRISCPRMLAML